MKVYAGALFRSGIFFRQNFSMAFQLPQQTVRTGDGDQVAPLQDPALHIIFRDADDAVQVAIIPLSELHTFAESVNDLPDGFRVSDKGDANRLALTVSSNSCKTRHPGC